jgi:ABC-2 type transport system ATP-binding protein
VAVVSVEHLSKRYGDLDAVNDVSFEVDEGDVFALLGPNGAGKTTTVEILEGFRDRDRGRVQVLGYDPTERSTARPMRERMGVVLQELAVEPFLSVRQVLARNAGYFPHPRPVDEIVHLVGLDSKADQRVKTLSGGQQRRLDLGLGIIGNPELLFLDEPTTGFDPSARRGAWDLVRALTSGGTTVILTTHYMDEVEALSNRVAVMTAGRIVAEGTPQSLGGRDQGEARIRFGLPAGVDPSGLPVRVTASSGDVLEIRTDREIEVLAALTGWALHNDVALTGLTVERLTLEDVYLRLTGYQSEPSEPADVPAAPTAAVGR